VSNRQLWFSILVLAVLLVGDMISWGTAGLLVMALLLVHYVLWRRRQSRSSTADGRSDSGSSDPVTTWSSADAGERPVAARSADGEGGAPALSGGQAAPRAGVGAWMGSLWAGDSSAHEGGGGDSSGGDSGGGDSGGGGDGGGGGD
jgi:hypothetical protein